MDLSALFKQAGKSVAENSPAILTAIGVTGTITTAYLAAKAAFQSVDVLREAEEAKKEEHFSDVSDPETGEPVEQEFEGLTTQEKIEAVWELYAPAAVSCALTVTAIICSNRISDRRTAAMASAYSVVKESYAEYRAKNTEKIGKKKEQEIRDEIAQDRINRMPVSKSTLLVTKRGGETLIKDAWSGRFFNSSRTLVDKAVNEFNSQVNKDGYASLSEFWGLLDIPPTSESDYIGWTSNKLLEIDWSGVIDEDDEPALCFTFKTLPDARFASAY